MADVALDTDGDLLIENGTLVLVEGIEAIKQNIQIRCQFILGEWFLNRLEGIPFFEDVLGTKNRELVVRGVFRRAIETTQGVKRIVSLDLSINGTTRVATVTASIQADTGHVFDVTAQREFVL